MINKKQLGNTDLQIAPWIFGGNVFGWTTDEKTSFELLDAFSGAGFNLIDTADVYSRWVAGNAGGESETIIGNWMKKNNKRNDVLISTKVGSDMGNGKKGVTKKYILQAAEDSLKRLQTDHIDLYQTHFDDEATPVQEALEAYSELVAAGKVRWIGTSNMSGARLKESLEASRQNSLPIYQSLQPEYNLYARERFEKEYEPICTENNIGVINYYALASGFLTGKYRSEKDTSKSARGGGMHKYFNERGFRILAALDKVAAAHNTAPASVSIAWLNAKAVITAPIASATNLQQVNDLIEAVSLKLPGEDIKLLDEASSY